MRDKTYTRPPHFDCLEYVTRSIALTPGAVEVEVRLEITLEEAQRIVPPSLATLAQNGGRRASVAIAAASNRSATCWSASNAPSSSSRPPNCATHYANWQRRSQRWRHVLIEVSRFVSNYVTSNVLRRRLNFSVALRLDKAFFSLTKLSGIFGNSLTGGSIRSRWPSLGPAFFSGPEVLSQILDLHCRPHRWQSHYCRAPV